MSILSWYLLSCFVTIILVWALAAKREWRDFPVWDRPQMVKLSLIVFCPVVNILYALAIAPFFFSDNPYHNYR